MSLMKDMLKIERLLGTRGYKLIAGVDEAGRGPLAGPVVAAAVILKEGEEIPGVDDSKKLTPRKREELFYEIRKKALSYGVGIVSHRRIDEINILNATYEAMNLAVKKLHINPDYVLVDGRDTPIEDKPQRAVIKGDSLSQSIAAASIIAKVVRDKMMMVYDNHYPEYGFAANKGYASKIHMKAIEELGKSTIHRQSFKLKVQEPKQLPLKLDWGS